MGDSLVFSTTSLLPESATVTPSIKPQALAQKKLERSPTADTLFSKESVSSYGQVCSQQVELMAALHSVAFYQRAFVSMDEIMEWGFALLRSLESPTETLGKAIFLMDREPSVFARHFKKKEGLASWMDQRVAKNFNCLLKELAQFKSLHEAAGLQAAEIAFSQRLPREVAKILITKSGCFNTALIPAVREYFIPKETERLPAWIAHLKQMLDRLSHNAALRTHLCALQPPKNPLSRAAHLVRIGLELPLKTLIKETEVRIAALSGLLAHFRQESLSECCFASHLVVEMLHRAPEKCLEDFAALLRQGSICRRGVVYPFLLKGSREGLKRKVQVNEELGNIPGIRAVCLALGLESKEALQLACKHLSKEVAVEEVLVALSEAAEGVTDAKEIAIFTFQSQLFCPIQRAWEYAVAGVGEGPHYSKILPAVTLAVQKALTPFLKPSQPLSALDVALAQRIRFLYDPCCTKDSGGFVTYDASGSKDVASWKRVDNSKSFIAMTAAVARTVFKEIPEEGELVRRLVEEQAARDMLNTYRLERGAPPIQRFQSKHLKFTPWINRTGADACDVWRGYRGLGECGKKEYVAKAITAEGLLIQLIQILRKLPLQQRAAAQNPYELIPCRARDVHAFSLLPGHPSFVEAWTSATYPRAWVHHRLFIPGLKIAHMAIGERIGKRLLKRAQEVWVPQEEGENFLKDCQALSFGSSVRHFRSQLLKVIAPYAKEGREEMALQLDTYLYRSLSSKMRREIEESAVHIADTNWASSDKAEEMHFCFVVNPGTGFLELWLVEELGSGLRPLSQLQWVREKEWQIFGGEWLLGERGYKGF